MLFCAFGYLLPAAAKRRPVRRASCRPAAVAVATTLLVTQAICAAPRGADTRELEAATPHPTKLGLAADFFRLYPASICKEQPYDADVVIYVCLKNGRPQQFNFDIAIPGLLVLTGVSLNAEAPNLGPSLHQLMRELGLSSEDAAGRAETYETISGASDLSAVKPPFVGAWGASTETCADQDDFYINTLISKTRFSQYELECRITAASPIGTTWILALACTQEGEELNTLARLTMENPDQITLETKDETKQSLQRCTGPVPAEYRSFFGE